MAGLILIIIFIGGVIWIVRERKLKEPGGPISDHLREILLTKVSFYQELNDSDKKRFEYRITKFLLNKKITGVNASVDDEVRVLVASSAIIPMFRFPEWYYPGLTEVLIYPKPFDMEFQIQGKFRNIIGLVGSGRMKGLMILSKPHLIQGFINASDGKNVGIHEFLHMIDNEDGNMDGIPSGIMNNQYSVPWLNVVRVHMSKIKRGKSKIDPYGATNRQEFFAVAGTYFFENPERLAKDHPELYATLVRVFNQKKIV